MISLHSKREIKECRVSIVHAIREFNLNFDGVKNPEAKDMIKQETEKRSH